MISASDLYHHLRSVAAGGSRQVQDQLNAVQLHCLGQGNSLTSPEHFQNAPMQPVERDITLPIGIFQEVGMFERLESQEEREREDFLCTKSGIRGLVLQLLPNMLDDERLTAIFEWASKQCRDRSFALHPTTSDNLCFFLSLITFRFP